MSVFDYTLPSGAEFQVRGPASATQLQADKIFYEQVAAGSLVGYQPGQTLTGTATQITKFELSRLDRGTAGVDNFPVLSITQGLPITPADLTTQSVLAAIQALPIPVGVPDLAEVPLTQAIDEADIVLIKGEDLSPDSVGDLTEYQVQKILAQIANLVEQESDQISLDKGIGRYGFTAYQLEQVGIVKPGTSQKFFSSDSADFVAVMSSPSVWTGKYGVYSLSDLLGNADLQNKIQVKLMQQGYNELLASGTIYKVPTAPIKISSGQVFTNSGLQSLQFLSTASLLAGNRGSSTLAVQNLLANNSTLQSLLRSANVNLSTIGSGAVGNLGNLSGLNAASLTSTITQRLTGGVGALVANASKFGSQATALWAKAGTLNQGDIGGSLTKLAGSSVNNIAGSLTGNLNNIRSNLTNLVPGSLGNLTSNLNVFGKAGSFATNFANPLGNLNNLGNVGNLGGLLNAGGGIGGALTGQSSQFTGVLANLGSLTNIGASGSLFGGGGDLVSGTQVAGGFNNTVNRATLDTGIAKIIGSNKVPLPVYQYPSPESLGSRLDIQQAENVLKNLQGQSTSAATRLLG